MSINSRYSNIKINSDMKILFIDDDAISHLTITTIFSGLFHSFDTATNTTEALKKLTAADFDCVITEIDMKDGNNLDFIKNIRQLNNLIPVIVLTSSRNTDRFIELINLGISGIVSKPIQQDELLRTLSKTFEKIGLVSCLKNKR